MTGIIEVTILIVDDNEEFQEIVKNSLNSSLVEFNILKAHSGADAIEILKDPSNKIDIVLSDYHMPGGNGTLIAEYLVAEDVHLPFVLMSNQELAECPEIGDLFISDYINKKNISKSLVNVLEGVIKIQRFEPLQGQENSYN